MTKYKICCLKFSISIFKKRNHPQIRVPPSINIKEESTSDLSRTSKERNAHKLNPISVSADSGLHSALTIQDPISPISEFCPTMSNKSSTWIQVSGHSGSFFKPEDTQIVLKVYSDEEFNAYSQISEDAGLSTIVAEFYGIELLDGQKYLKLEDLLTKYTCPAIMDCKIGCRTYLEEDVDSKKCRKDLFEKMLELCPNEPTEEERERGEIPKSRYMKFRENLSSTVTLAFRVEATKVGCLEKKVYPRAQKLEEVKEIICEFVNNSPALTKRYLEIIQNLRNIVASSAFFSNYEMIGSSLLFIHEAECQTGETALVKMIDFARFKRCLTGKLSHCVFWETGSQEEGYLIGIDNIANILQSIISK